MKFKYIALAGMVSALYCGTAFSASPSIATMTATGNIVAHSTCEVLSPTATVTLNSVSVDKLGMKTDTPDNPALYTLTASGCTPGSVSVSVSGTAASDVDLLATNADSGAATNVGIGFWSDISGSQTFIPVNQKDIPATIDDSGVLSVGLNLAPVKLNASDVPTAGTIAATANLKINYL